MPSPPASCPRPRQLAHAGVTSASPFLCADVHEFLYAPTIFDPATSESWQPARIAAAARGHPATACRQACTAIRQLALPTNALAWPQPSHLLMRPVYPAALIFCRQVHAEGRPGGAHAPPPLPRHLAAAARLPGELPAGCCLRLCSRLHTRPPPPHPPRRKHRSAQRRALLPTLAPAVLPTSPRSQQVFVGGGDVSNDRTAELYSPPYLFKGPRPAISSVQDTIKVCAPIARPTWWRVPFLPPVAPAHPGLLPPLAPPAPHPPRLCRPSAACSLGRSWEVPHTSTAPATSPPRFCCFIALS